MKSMKLIFKIIIVLWLGFMLELNPRCVIHAVQEETHKEIKTIQHEEHASSSEEHHVEVQHDEEHASSSGEHADSAGHQGETHHIWWQFPGYEIVLGALSCLDFALFIIIIPYFFGKDLGSHDPLEEHH